MFSCMDDGNCWNGQASIRERCYYPIATMQNRFRELDIFSFSLSEGFIPITDSGTNDHFR